MNNSNNNDDKTTAAAESGEQSGNERVETYYEKTRDTALSLESWDEIADVKLLGALFKEQNLTQTEKEFIISIFVEKAKKLKRATEFKKILSAVKKEVAKDRDYQRSTYNHIAFFDTPLVLASRNFSCDNSNIYNGSELVISQPLIISKIFIDVEDFTESVELSYCKPFDTYPKWYEINVPKEVISNKNKIISLAAYGIMVTTENAGKVSEYLISLIADNAKYIPVVKGVSRMGYVDDEFVPYADEFKYNFACKNSNNPPKCGQRRT